MRQISELAVKEKNTAIVYLFTKSCGYCGAMGRDVLGAGERLYIIVLNPVMYLRQ